MKALGLALCVGLFACSDSRPGSGLPDPSGLPPMTFCYDTALTPTDPPTQTCVTGSDLSANRTTTQGNLMFKVTGQLEIESKDESGFKQKKTYHAAVSGQLPENASLPRDADATLLTIPILGSCGKGYPTAPFPYSPCHALPMDAVCAPTSQGDAGAKVTVVALTATSIELSLSANLSLLLPDACCVNYEGCPDGTPPASFDPGGPVRVQGAIKALF